MSAVLVVCGPATVAANEAELSSRSVNYTPDARPFTTAEIRMVLDLMDLAKRRLNPEYYLSNEYLYENATSSEASRRQNLRQQKWKQAARHRQELRDQRIAEREANRVRIRTLRDQERTIQRIQRQAQRAQRQREFCAWRQRRVQFYQQARHHKHSHLASRANTYRHPQCR